MQFSMLYQCLLFLALTERSTSWISPLNSNNAISGMRYLMTLRPHIIGNGRKSSQFLTRFHLKLDASSLSNPLQSSSDASSKGFLFIGGLGNTATIISAEAAAAGYKVTGTSRGPEKKKAPEGVEVIHFTDSAAVLAACTHLLLTAPPASDIGDPFLARYGALLSSRKACPNLRWIGYLSSTGVYGNRNGSVVDETSAPMPTNERSVRRIPAEDAWRHIAASLDVPLDIFRCGGIYADPSYNSTFDLVRAGTARCIIAHGHSFPRIHVHDVARGVLAAAAQHGRRPPAPRILHLVDDSLRTPASEVVAYAAELLGYPPPPAVPLAVAWETMPPGLRSFWGEDVKVRNELTKAALQIEWRYPTYREGLRALLEDERRRGKWCGPGPAPPSPPPPP